MTPNEIKIVEEKDKVSKRKVAELLGISTDYSGYILELLANGGYLAKVDRGIYTLLPKGANALLSQLYFEEVRSEAGILRYSMEKESIKKEIERLSVRRNNLVCA